MHELDDHTHTHLDGTTSPNLDDTVQTRAIDDMRRIKWHQPDDDFGNSTHIAELKKELDQCWGSTECSDEYLADINAARAASAWLMCTLLKANFAHANAYDVDNVKARVEALETYKTGLEDYKWWEKKQINSLFEQDAELKRDVKHWTTQTERAEQALQQFKSDTAVKMAAMEARLKNLITNLDKKVDDALINKATIPKKTRWLRFRSEMPPDTHTLPGLLAQLERPDTP